jgi:SAM-dependent methyltransferase
MLCKLLQFVRAASYDRTLKTVMKVVAQTLQKQSIYARYRALRSHIRVRLFGPRMYLDQVVLFQELERIASDLPVGDMDALEISGTRWAKRGFRSFVSANYPEYDVCEKPLSGSFDIIVAEQVFEHLLWPHRATKNVYAMLRPGGYFLVTTPFLQKVHNYPIDCSRWTETGLKHLLADSGFDLRNIQTGSWGNRASARANLRHRYKFPIYIPMWSSLKNDPTFPVQVWALARRQ